MAPAVAAGFGSGVASTSKGGVGAATCRVAPAASVVPVTSFAAVGVCVGAGVAVGVGAKGMAVGGADPAHAVRANSIRRVNPIC